MIIVDQIPVRELREGDIIAISYRNADQEWWARSEYVIGITKHQDGTTTLRTDYKTYPRMAATARAPQMAQRFDPMLMSEFYEEVSL